MQNCRGKTTVENCHGKTTVQNCHGKTTVENCHGKTTVDTVCRESAIDGIRGMRKWTAGGMESLIMLFHMPLVNIFLVIMLF